MTSTSATSSDRIIGQVKWFNNKVGYGFITVKQNGQDSDIFVHHSNVTVSSEQYKYLIQGEYVEFAMKHTENSAHEYQAENVSGINGGKLMCETRNDNRQMKPADDGVPSLRVPSSRVASSRAPSSRAPTQDEPATPRTPRVPSEEPWKMSQKVERTTSSGGRGAGSGRGSGGRGAGRGSGAKTPRGQ
jgi:CspA family cold shock protein